MIRCWDSDPKARPEFKEIVKVISRIRQSKNLYDPDQLSASSFVSDRFPFSGGSFSEGTCNENSDAGMMIKSMVFQHSSSSFDSEVGKL